MKQPLLDRMRAGLDGREWTRVHVLLIVGLSGGVAFLLSVLLLTLHLHSMAWRYGLASLAGYGTFLLLVRGWVQWKRQQFVPDMGGVDLSGLPGPGDLPWSSGRAADVATNAFRGGRSGGGGSSMVWDSHGASVTSSGGKGGGGGFSLDLDGDDLFWLLVALAAALASVFAIAYVIYIAPTLMSEAALNAAVAGRVYRGLQRRESHHWTTDMLRRTALPAAVVVISLGLAGYALQRVAPEAQSIGGVWYHLRG